MDDQPRQRLDAALNQRRLDLHLKWADLAKLSGLTTETIRQVRSGDADIRPLTKRGLEGALGWKPGSIDSILGGGDPELLPVSTGHTNGASTYTQTWRGPTGDTITVTLPAEGESVFSPETEARLKQIAANPDRSPGLRAMATMMLSQLAAIRDADAAEEEASREAG